MAPNFPEFHMFSKTSSDKREVGRVTVQHINGFLITWEEKTNTNQTENTSEKNVFL